MSGSGSPAPTRAARWLLTAALFATYLGVQLVVAAPFVVWLLVTSPNLTPATLIEAPLVVWGTLISAATGALATAALAWGWPRVWTWLTGRGALPLADWVAWRSPQHVPLWVIAVMTLPLVFAVSFGVQALLGPSEVAAQAALFASPARQIFAALLVSTVVPLAEELIFRGALYNALLPARAAGDASWTDHVAPLLVTTLLFAAVHGLAGFDSLPPFIAVGALALYLGLLRAVTGSVRASIVGHVVWNLVGAVGLTLLNYFPVK